MGGLAASGVGGIGRKALPFLKIRRPPLPAVRHPGDREQPGGLMPVMCVDAKDIPDGETLIGFLDNPNLIAGADVTLGDDSQVGAGAHRLGEPAHKLVVVHSHAKPPARDPRLGNFEEGRPDLPTLADERTVHVDPVRREVLAELAVCERSADLLLPPPSVFNGVDVDRFVRTSVRRAIRLIVSGKIDSSGRDPAGGGRPQDGAPDIAPAVFELPGRTDADRQNSSRGKCHGSAPVGFFEQPKNHPIAPARMGAMGSTAYFLYYRAWSSAARRAIPGSGLTSRQLPVEHLTLLVGKHIQ